METSSRKPTRRTPTRQRTPRPAARKGGKIPDIHDLETEMAYLTKESAAPVSGGYKTLDIGQAKPAPVGVDQAAGDRPDPWDFMRTHAVTMAEAVEALETAHRMNIPPERAFRVCAIARREQLEHVAALARLESTEAEERAVRGLADECGITIREAISARHVALLYSVPVAKIPELLTAARGKGGTFLEAVITAGYQPAANECPAVPPTAAPAEERRVDPAPEQVPSAERLSPEGFYSPVIIAKYLGCHVTTLRRKLREIKDALSFQGAVLKGESDRQNEPAFLYKLAAVEQYISRQK